MGNLQQVAAQLLTADYYACDQSGIVCGQFTNVTQDLFVKQKFADGLSYKVLS